MKMYLSSYRLGNKSQSLVNLVGVNKYAAVIANSIDFGDDLLRRSAGVQREIDDLTQLGLIPEELDLRKYFSKPQDLLKLLPKYGMFWVRGGNVFVLRRAFKQSGFDNWLVGQRDNKELVYAGYSAGVCVLSRDLKGNELVDDPNVISEGYQKETIWDGLGLIDFAFAPHFESPGHPETEAVGKQVEYYIREGIEFKALHDGEVIIDA